MTHFTDYAIDLREWETDSLPAILRDYPRTRIADSLRRLMAAHSEHVTLGAFMDTGAVCAWTPSTVHAGDDMRVVTGWEGAQ